MFERPRAVVGAAWLVNALLIGCGHAVIDQTADLGQSTRIVAPPCTPPTSRVDVLGVRRDTARPKPSPDVLRLLVDIRVRVHDPRGLWLLIGEDTFPSGVDEVDRSADRTWWFEGASRVEAIWLGPLTDVTFTSRQVAGGWTPFVLGVIEVGNTTPQGWVQQGGSYDRRSTRGRRVPAHMDVVCATWVDLRETPARHSDQGDSGQ